MRLKRVDFDKLSSVPLENLERLPSISAVYFVFYRQTIIYIGRSHDIRFRWNLSNHHILRKLDTPDITISWIEVSQANIENAELDLIGAYRPFFNSLVKTNGEWKVSDLLVDGEFSPPKDCLKTSVGISLNITGQLYEAISIYAGNNRMSASAATQRAASRLLAEHFLGR